jgi:hypothetical protein
MSPLQIKRRRSSNTDPKQALRAHVGSLPVDQQHAFIAAALQLISGRTENHTPENKIRQRHRQGSAVDCERYALRE